ncbi:MAG: hypothetical protein U0T83_00075 [Bacteriovoracaceae bacterium]
MATVLLIYTIVLAYIAIVDFKTRKIANYWSLFNLFFSITLFIFLPQHYILGYKHFFIPGLVFVAGFILYFMKIAGAGDVKFLSTFLIALPYDFQLLFVNKLVVSTIIFALTVMGIKIITQFKAFTDAIFSKNFQALRSVIFGSKFAYSPVLFFTLLLVIWESGII